MFIKIGIISLAIAFSFCAAVGLIVQKTGLLIVNVQNRDGNLFLPVPLLLVNGALNFAPIADKVSMPHEFQHHSEVVQAAATELLNCPDGPFVEISNRDANMMVSKQGENLIVDIKTDDKKVYVQIPIKATGKTLAKLASLNVENEL